MRLTANRISVRVLLQWTQRALFAGGILTLGYCGFVLLDTWRFQNLANVDLAANFCTLQRHSRAKFP